MPKVLELYEEIGYWGLRAQDVSARLKALALQPQDELLVALNSPGGEIYEGLGIYAAIKHAPVSKRTVRVDGLAASMGSIIAMAGDEIIMGDGALMMIHDPSGMAWGTADDMRELADILDKHRDALVSIYEKRSGKTADEIKALMAAETWFTGAEAVAAGFATVLGAAVPQATAHFNKDRTAGRFRHMPAAAARFFTARAPAPPPQAQEPKKMDKDRIRRRSLVAALLGAVAALAGLDQADAELAKAGEGARERTNALKGATPDLQDLGDPVALLETVGTVSGREAPSFTDGVAEVLTLSARAQHGQTSESAVKAQLLDEAIKAGKPVAPAHREAWQRLPLDKLRATLDGLPVTNQLPQAQDQRKPSANPKAAEAQDTADESYQGMRAGLGLKKVEAK